METILALIYQFFEELFSFYNSSTFAVIKFIIGIYCVVLLVNIILMLFQRSLVEDLSVTLKGEKIPNELSTGKSKLKKKWLKLKEGLEGENEAKYKIAIIKADDVIGDLIRRMAYPGKNLSERLAAMSPGEFDCIDDLRKAHETRNRIINDESFHLTKEMAEETFSQFEKFLHYFNVLD